ncbi:AT-rich binding protein-like [Drosophila hydei]|uniref:AT-rich binding protein-like n=1 Tax=Drosophila hydei TaxID=7224 RepID=A0A6J1L877_DROHY|nr:AT-rich binding protein-like [Drosophila hydei]
MASVAVALEHQQQLQQQKQHHQQQQQLQQLHQQLQQTPRDATDDEVELYASFDMAPSTSRVAAQMQAAKEARRKRWAADGASGSSDGGCASGSSGSGRRY